MDFPSLQQVQVAARIVYSLSGWRCEEDPAVSEDHRTGAHPLVGCASVQGSVGVACQETWFIETSLKEGEGMDCTR